MIVNHQYRFIFLKTRKTAGTSMEIALSRFCGDGDIVTPISDEDEVKRRALGHAGPRNYALPWRRHGFSEWMRLARKGKRRVLFNHIEAADVRAHVGEAVWSGYFKFCFERDPFDKAISRYFWSTRGAATPPDVATYLREAPVRLLSNWSIYTLNDRLAVDYVGRYENLAADLASITERLGLPEPLVLPQAKSGYRVRRDHYSKLLSEEARERVSVVCAKEMYTFGYRWTEAPLS